MTLGYGSIGAGCSAMDTNITRADELKETTGKTFDDGCGLCLVHYPSYKFWVSFSFGRRLFPNTIHFFPPAKGGYFHSSFFWGATTLGEI